ncbi:MAG: DUF4258 domain-containing protein [Nitrososphaerales archaeon]
MQIEISKHAREKLSILRAHGVRIAEEQIRKTLIEPEKVLDAWEGRLIAQKALDETHILRVVYIRERQDKIRVITVYPARSGRY